MKKNKSKAIFYLKWAAVFGVIGWTTAFLAVAIAALGQIQLAIYTGAFSLFVGWVISGYFWLRFGISEGMTLKEIILHRKKK